MKRDFCSKIYETTADAYDGYRRADPDIAQGVFERLNLPQGSACLEIGCGSGNYTRAFADKGLAMTGLDLSPAMNARAKKKSSAISWHLGDMRDVPFADHQFAGCLTINTLHYVRHSLVEVFSHAHRVLMPGGRFVLFAVSLEQCLQFWVGHYFPFFRQAGEKVLTPLETIRAALKEAGFQTVQTEPYFVTKETQDLF